jgi:hypothetical protein
LLEVHTLVHRDDSVLAEMADSVGILVETIGSSAPEQIDGEDSLVAGLDCTLAVSKRVLGER